ncbi:hypothetical protein C1637_09920 [Chryseobacterium lactis]|uniref:Uncharacterized protein n=1 Tax=Chryseobacterium lactis TaxID=1241981 RepID=A0A3G6RKJ5_CHRLC|nr:hypothetical protein [Chryseobacterium lactis]AZA82173.1 hypothetical protein EG342_09780 [Chryseobacterium lactis]AZB02554.1 hypothetical protein EG341_00635 [Chryseobacterium lactis]PNW14151.1 hypothetical protein C1637_09920 [Chryseobacterium lactis]
MSIKNIAAKIPDEVRSQVLLTESDIISNTVAVWDNSNMQKLLKIWHTFIEPGKEVTSCPICLRNILTNFNQMKPFLIELENEYQKLQRL